MSAVISNATIDVKPEDLPEVVALSIISLYTTAEMSPEQETLLVEWVNKHISAHMSGDNYIVYFVDESLCAADSVSHFLHVTTVDRKDDYHDIVKMGHKRVVSMTGSELTWTSRFDKFFTNFVFTVYERCREGEHATKLIA